MTAPWETKETNFAPWEEGKKERVVEDRMPEGLAFGRFMVKNLGTDPMSSVKYLEKEYGKDFDFDIESGEILAKKKGDKTWGKLDPSGIELQDISDVGYDIGAGTLTGAATAIGGLGGGVPLAALSGSGASTGLEALRQKLGQATGVSENMDNLSLLMAAGTGAISPMLFGTGASAAGVAKAAAKAGKAEKLLGKLGIETGEQGITEAQKKVAADELMRLQKGWLSRGASTAGEFLTGLNRETIESANVQAPSAVKRALGFADDTDITNLEAVDLMKNKEGSAAKVAKQLENDFRKKVSEKNKELSAMYDTAIGQVDSQGPTIDTNQGIQAIKEGIGEILSTAPKAEDGSSLLSPQDKSLLSRLKALGKKHLSNQVPEQIQNADGTLSTKITYQPKGKVTVKEAKRIEKNTQDLIDSQPELKDSTFTRTLIELNDRISQQTKEAVDSVYPGLDDTYRDWNQTKEVLKPFFKGTVGFDRALRTSSSDAKQVIFDTAKRLDSEAGTSLEQGMRFMDVKSMLQRPSFEPISVKGATSTSRTIPAAEAMASLLSIPFGETGAKIGRAVGSKIISPAMVKKSLQASRLLQKGAKKTGLPQGKQALLNKLSESPISQSALSGAISQPLPWLQMMNERGD